MPKSRLKREHVTKERNLGPRPVELVFFGVWGVKPLFQNTLETPDEHTDLTLAGTYDKNITICKSSL